MVVFGITGGSGSGKTSVLDVFKNEGAHIIDCDALYYEMLKPGTPMHTAIETAFGAVFNEQGQLDRKKLGEIVFNNPERLKQLDDITFKYFQHEVDSQIERQRELGRRITAVDGATLIQARAAGNFKCDCMMGVIAPNDIRIERIVKRDNITREMAESRIKAQQDDEFYRGNCDVVIKNDSATKEEFTNEIVPFIKTLIEKTEENRK